jgi:hypothetical protein
VKQLGMPHPQDCVHCFPSPWPTCFHGPLGPTTQLHLYTLPSEPALAPSHPPGITQQKSKHRLGSSLFSPHHCTKPALSATADESTYICLTSHVSGSLSQALKEGGQTQVHGWASHQSIDEKSRSQGHFQTPPTPTCLPGSLACSYSSESWSHGELQLMGYRLQQGPGLAPLPCDQTQ